jgi:hypothetical protein
MKKNLLKIKKQIVAESIIVWDKTKWLGKYFQREAHETEVASKILMRIVKGKKVTPEEINFLKDQSVDVGKALALIGIQVFPGSTLAIFAMEKVGRKYGFTIFPKAQKEPGQEKNDIAEQCIPSGMKICKTIEIK